MIHEKRSERKIKLTNIRKSKEIGHNRLRKTKMRRARYCYYHFNIYNVFTASNKLNSEDRSEIIINDRQLLQIIHLAAIKGTKKSMRNQIKTDVSRETSKIAEVVKIIVKVDKELKFERTVCRIS